jgi:hypothetical protein
MRPWIPCALLPALLVACAGNLDNSNPGDPSAAPDEESATSDDDTAPDAAPPDAAPPAEHVFVIVMENHDWDEIAGNPNAPYLNDTLLAIGAHGEAYTSPPGLHPSEPNYIWLEAGDSLGLTTDEDPSATHSTGSTTHLVTQLEAAGVAWKSYAEDAPSDVCPLASAGFYAARHDPFVFFRDVTGDNDPASPRCIEHVRPLTELQADLDAGTVPGYAFVVPNLCNDMHGASGCPAGDLVARGDAWLARVVPAILGSSRYAEGHTTILITWDESESAAAPIGMIAISPRAKAGYASDVPMTHSSTLRTVQELLGVGGWIGAAAASNDLSDLFVTMP